MYKISLHTLLRYRNFVAQAFKGNDDALTLLIYNSKSTNDTIIILCMHSNISSLKNIPTLRGDRVILRQSRRTRKNSPGIINRKIPGYF